MIQASWRDRLRTGALALVAFVLAHDLIFLVTYRASFGAAFARAGHGDVWTATVALVAIMSAVLAGAGAVRLIQLSRLARELDVRAGGLREAGVEHLVGHLGRAWLAIFAIALVVFVGVENVEHVAVGLPLPGVRVLGSSEYQFTLLVFGAVSLVGALVDALYRWRQDVLVARIQAARARWTRAERSGTRPDLPWIERRHRAIVGHRIAGRAPPVELAR